MSSYRRNRTYYEDNNNNEKKLKYKIKELERMNKRLINENKQLTRALEKSISRIKDLENRKLEEILLEINTNEKSR